MDPRAYFSMLARYNAWATRRLFEHVDALPEAEYRRDCGLFFKSVHGTLNHLLVAEHEVWFPRFAEGVSNRVALDAEVEADRTRLRQRLLDAAPRWLPLIAALEATRFDGTLDYTTTRGISQSLPFAATLGHVFNHGTHHRGQMTAAITAMGYAGPEIDLVWMLQAEGDAADSPALQPTDRVAALWAAFQARDWVGARRLFADAATLTWHASGERLLDADAIIRVNAIYPEGWSLRVVEINALQGGRVHSIVEVTHGGMRFLANSLFRFDATGRIVEVDEYWATVEAPPVWRTAEAIGAYERFPEDSTA